jgi:plastocyanin
MKFRHFGYALVATILVLAGCGKKDNSQTSEAPASDVSGTANSAANAPVSGATLSGSVQFAGAKPTPKKIQMTADAYCKTQHAQGAVSEEVVVNPNGTLKNVYVYVKSGLGDKKFPPSANAAVLDQKGCVYTPHVLGVQAGQAITVRNSDGVLHNINARPKVNKGFNFGQPVQNMESKKTFDKAELAIPVKCDVHPWMNSYIHVSDHPFFAVTGDDGSFSLKGLPAGTYEVEAWHEKYGASKQSVTVGETDPKPITFSFKGA